MVKNLVGSLGLQITSCGLWVDALRFSCLPCLPAGREAGDLLITYVRDRPGHDRRYAIDCSKIEKELRWQPREIFETGLKKTIQWYLENPDWVESVQTGEYRVWMQKHYKTKD